MVSSLAKRRSTMLTMKRMNANVADTACIMETRPLSKTKRWRD